MLDMWLKNGKVYLEGRFTEASVGVKDGKVALIRRWKQKKSWILQENI